MLNGDQVNDVKIRNKSWCPLWTLLTDFILKVLVMQSGKKKGIQFIKEEIKWPLFKDDMIVHLENPKESTKKALRTNEFNKVTRC